MIAGAAFGQACLDRGYRLFAGVPCSHLGGPLRWLTDRGMYVPAADEGAALAIAAGARLAGARSGVLIQNSGLGNLVNPMTSLLQPFAIPVLAIVTLRGWPDAESDEPQHAVMGRATHAILDACGVPHRTLTGDLGDLERALADADAAHDSGLPFFLLAPRGTVESTPATSSERPAAWTRREAIATLAPHLGAAAVFATTGYVARELFARADAPTNFYMQGSMGHALALGLGTALARPERRVVVIDGDGALLMHLGTACTVGAAAPANLLHVVIDNGMYESTGGQPTTAGIVDWAGLARSLGYASAAVCCRGAELVAALAAPSGAAGPALIAVRVSPAADAVPPRATSAVPPRALAERFARALGDDDAGVAA